MKKLLLVLLVISSTNVYAQQPGTPWQQHGRLGVSSSNPHLLSFADGTLFFWLADTGWELVHRLKKEEVTMYFKKRAAQGFNVIQTVALSEFNGLSSPNAYGRLPLKDRNPAEPDTSGTDSYWSHLDFIITEAGRQGLFVALLPCWGEYVIPREDNGIFSTAAQAYDYGNFIGRRYRASPNIIWILGGDRLPAEIPAGIALWRAMAKGIADGTNGVSNINGITDYSTTLITYHCSASSSTWFQKDAWLDFNMWGSYHSDYNIAKAFEQSHTDWNLLPAKPTLNGEPAYEDHPVNWLPGNGYFTAYDVRQIAYWSVFAGACGHTYGCNAVWQFYDSTRQATYVPLHNWQQSLDDEGASQLQHLRKLVESRPMAERHPANEIITNLHNYAVNDHPEATAGKHYAFIYLPTGHTVSIDLAKLHAATVTAWWYNPRTGDATNIGNFRATKTIFTPPGISKELSWLKTGRGCDWVLVLDDAAQHYSAPGNYVIN